MAPQKTNQNTVEDRLLGIERRFDHFEEKLREDHMEILRLSNKVYELGNLIVKMEDRIISAIEQKSSFGLHAAI